VRQHVTAEALSAFSDQGITFSLSGQERPFPLDLVPRVMSSPRSPDWHSCLFGHRSEDGRVDENMQVGRQGPGLWT
jgi:hypothetical protein